MSGQEITIHGPDGDFMGYLAAPEGGGPGIVVAQEIFGVNAFMREVCDELAAAGYMALCPDLFWRHEPGVQLDPQSEVDWQRAFQLYQGFDVDKGVADLGAALEHLRTTPGSSGKVGSVGYCLGGLLAYLMATRTASDCSVGYYGVGIQDRLDEAANIAKPLLLHIAEEDEFVPKEAQATITSALAAAPNLAIHSYPGAGHAFARRGGQHHDQAAAELANGRTMAFFGANLS